MKLFLGIVAGLGLIYVDPSLIIIPIVMGLAYVFAVG